MSKIADFASNSVMGVVRKIVNHLVDNVDPQIADATDHLPARFSGTFNDETRNLTMTIESQGASAENLVATVNIPAGGGGSGGPTYSAGNGINITPTNAIEIDTNITATKASVVALQNEVGDAFSQVAIGADGKSLDFTALDGQVNNIVLPSSGGSTWSQVTATNIGAFNWKTGDIIYGTISYDKATGDSYSIEFIAIYKITLNNINYFVSNGYCREYKMTSDIIHQYPIGKFKIDTIIKCSYQSTFGTDFTIPISESINYDAVFTNASLKN